MMMMSTTSTPPNMMDKQTTLPSSYHLEKISVDKQHKRIKYVRCGWVCGELRVYSISTEGVLHIYSVNEEKTILSVTEIPKKVTISKYCVVHDSWDRFITILQGYIYVFKQSGISEKGGRILDYTKGCSVFSSSEKSGFLCAICRKTLIVCRWDGAELVLHTKHALPMNYEGLVCIENHVFLYSKKEKLLLAIESGESMELPDFLKDVQVTHVSVISGISGQQDDLLVVCGTQGFLIDAYGQNSHPRNDDLITWTSPPNEIYYQHPYLFSCFADFVQLHNLQNFLLVQEISIKSASICLTPASHDVFVISPTGAYRMWMKPIHEQVAELLDLGHYGSAIALCQACPLSAGISVTDLKELQAKYGYELFKKGEYENAMHNFALGDVNPKDIIALFPNELVPRGFQLDGNYDPIEILQVDQLRNALIALIQYLRDHQGLQKKRGYSTDRQLHDTVLLKALVLTEDKEIKQFLNSDNDCDIGECQVFLRAHGKWNELLIFFSNKKLHRKYLELVEELERVALSSLSTNTFQQEILQENQFQQETKQLLQSCEEYQRTMVVYLQKLPVDQSQLIFEFSSRILKQNPALGLRIFTHRNDDDPDNDDPDNDDSMKEESLPTSQVLQHLKSIGITDIKGEEMTISSESEWNTNLLLLVDGKTLAIEYLIHRVAYEKENQSQAHDELIYLLLDAITSELEKMNATQKSQSHPTHSTHSTHRSSYRLLDRVSVQSGRLGSLRRKLLGFLRFSNSYHPERMLSRTPVEMVEERAVLLGKLGRHEEVLRLYVLELKDAVYAEMYCGECYESGTNDSKDIYLSLLKFYLRPLKTPGSQPTWQDQKSLAALTPALDLLKRHYLRLDIEKALDLLPPDVPASELESYFTSVLQQKVNEVNNCSVAKNLRKLENLDVQDKLYRTQARMVKRSHDYKCPVCRRNIGKSAFLCYPNGNVIHYSCGGTVGKPLYNR